MIWHGNNFRGIINKAKEMIFDNTGTDLISTNAEDAIKEVNSNLSQITLIKCHTVNILQYTSANGMFTIPYTDLDLIDTVNYDYMYQCSSAESGIAVSPRFNLQGLNCCEGTGYNGLINVQVYAIQIPKS